MPEPVPKSDEVLVRIHASAVTAVDNGYRRSFGRSNSRKAKGKMLGCYLAGEIENVGRDVTGFQKGDRVYGGDVFSLGACAEYKCLREDRVLVKMPAAMSYREAAVFTYGTLTALPFLRDAGKIKKGQKVLVIGASGDIGVYAVQLAGYYGAEVTGVCSAAGLDLVSSLGASRVIDYTREDFTKNGQTYDIILDTPAKYSFSRCRGSLTGNGRYLTTVPWPKDLLRMLWTSVSSRKKAIFRPMGLRSKRNKIKDLLFLNGLFESGRIKSVVGKAFPLEDIVAAHRYVEQSHKKGCVVITMD